MIGKLRVFIDKENIVWYNIFKGLLQGRNLKIWKYR